jgi:hypothetical protein
MTSRATGKEAARARVAQLKAAQVRAERRRRALLGVAAVGAVLLIVVALVLAKAAGLGSKHSSSTTSSTSTGSATPLPAAVARAVTAVPPSTLDAVGVDGVTTVPKAIHAPALTQGGKPKVLYVGAEFCPFCAAQRWPVVVALSRFGTWHGLAATESATNDVFPGTPTLSFHGATYTSDYLAFTGVETTTNQPRTGGGYRPLDSLSPADQQVFDTYDRPPYVDGSPGSIPFLDLGGKFALSGASYSPELLKGKTRAQIAAGLKDPNDPVAQAIDGSANLLSAALCALTNQKPAAVCTSSGVKAAATKLAGSP